MKQSVDYRNILIIKPSSLGDIVHTLPAFNSLRLSFPNAKISWLVRKQFASLLECVPGIDHLILFDRKLLGKWWYSPTAFRAFRDFLRTLRQGRFDLVLDMQGLFRTAFFAYQTGCPHRLGMTVAREGAGIFYSRKIAPPPNSIHLIDYYNHIVAEVGGKTFCESYTLLPSAPAIASVQKKLADAGLADRPFAALIPGSAHMGKCWPTQRFAKIAEKITRELNMAVVGVGTAVEYELVEQIRRNTSTPVTNLAGQTDIPELLALFSRAGLVVSNDTGPGHIAVATKTPTVLIFGHTNPLRVGPYRKPENAAAIDSLQRGPATENENPAYAVANISEQLVWGKICNVLQQNPAITVL
jgi:lipopolysaccharide heptosyltransferase I